MSCIPSLLSTFRCFMETNPSSLTMLTSISLQLSLYIGFRTCEQSTSNLMISLRTASTSTSWREWLQVASKRYSLTLPGTCFKVRCPGGDRFQDLVMSPDMKSYKEDMVFDYFETKHSYNKLRPETSIFDTSNQLPCYNLHNYNITSDDPKNSDIQNESNDDGLRTGSIMEESLAEKSENSCKINPQCKKPVVFLDGRKNPKVTDFVFIFDPNMAPDQSTNKPEVQEILSPTCSIKTETFLGRFACLTIKMHPSCEDSDDSKSPCIIKSSKEDMVFDYFQTNHSSHKLRPETSFEMKTFNTSSQLPCYHGHKYNITADDPYDSNNHDFVNRHVDQNGLRPEVGHHHHHCVQLYEEDDDDELQQVVIDDSSRKYVNNPHSSRPHRQHTHPGDAVAFFPRAISANQVLPMEAISSSRGDSSAEGEELQLESTQATIGSSFVSSSCLNNLICKANDRSEVEKRIHRRQIKREHMRKKVPECRSEDIPEYKGQLTVDEILAFIDDNKINKPVHSFNKSLKKEDAKPNKTKCFFDNDISLVDPMSDDVEQGPIGEESDDSMQKKIQEVAVVTVATEELSLATSSSTSSFRTASPPVDIPLVTLDDEPIHSSTMHKEFIMVQKKKKLKQFSTPNKREGESFSIFEINNSTLEQQKSSLLSGRQSGFKTHLGFFGHQLNPKNCLASEVMSDDNNNVSTLIPCAASFLEKKVVPCTSSFVEKKVAPDHTEEFLPKSESQIDPSQFPELPSGRRNSTGSSGPNSEDSSKGFTFSYADIAAKLKKHSSDVRQRRGSLQLNCQENIDKDPIAEQTKVSNLSKNSDLQSESNDDGLRTCSIMEESLASSQLLPVEKSENSCKINPQCKEPVVFLDGRKNPKVTDLVFIFDPSMAPDQSTNKPEVQEILSPTCSIKTETFLVESNASSNKQTFNIESEAIDRLSSHRFSPGIFSTPVHQSTRPSPLSNHYPAGRQVVKVSPMPIVARSVTQPKKNIDIDSKSPEITKCIGSQLNPSVQDKMSVQRNTFNLREAQMYLYAAFQECIEESKRNPDNVVMYRE